MNCKTLQTGLAALLTAAALAVGAGTASAGTVTIDFGTGGSSSVSGPYVEDGFEIAGSELFVSSTAGNPVRAIIFDDRLTPTLTLTRVGGGAFSLVGFDYSCADLAGCNFSVGGTMVTSGSASFNDFATLSPSGFTNITSLLFTSNMGIHFIDNIVLTYDADVPPIPLPAGLLLLLGGLAGLGLMARRKRRAA
jgi:hypothetical protein